MTIQARYGLRDVDKSVQINAVMMDYGLITTILRVNLNQIMENLFKYRVQVS